MDSLLKVLENDKIFKEWEKALISDEKLCISGVLGSFKSILLKDMLNKNKKFILVTPTETIAREVLEDLENLGSIGISLFPKVDFITGEILSHSKDNEWERINLLNKKEHNSIIMSIDALNHKLVPRKILESNEIKISVGKENVFSNFINSLANIGYERVTIVDSKGQFTVRGSIIDIFDPFYENPIRIEFFDDEIDSIRFFNVDTQKSTEKINEITLYPCQEIILNGEIIEKLKFQGIDEYIIGKRPEGLMPYVYDSLETVFDYFPDYIIVFLDLFRIKTRYDHLREETLMRFQTDIELEKVLPKQVEVLADFREMYTGLKNYINICLVDQEMEDIKYSRLINFHLNTVSQYSSRIDLLANDLKEDIKKGYKVILSLDTEEKSNMVKRGLQRESLEIRDIDSGELITSSLIGYTRMNLTEGFYISSSKVILITSHDIFGEKKKKKVQNKFDQNSKAIKSLRDLNPGDLVVHESHGISKYVGIEKVNTDNVIKDYMKLMYQNEEFLYIPIDQMNVIQKYIGADEGTVKINRLGSLEWKKAKQKAKKAIEDMTEELLALYSKRLSQIGYQFSKDSEWQKDFESLFPYEETSDQLKCIDEIKADMEKPIPMDRLLCGDVGFGKTEVAIRAIFKAVNDSKQVAILVPTTILAYQHFNNLKERFNNYPIKIEMLSRFRTSKQQGEIVKLIGKGVVDIVIGTHRVLSEDVKFKDLGLLIIDEEQRFGVKHKESLKKLRSNIDVLSMTATPIPRTLNMSLIGIRDMSIINDPPEDRYPIQTYITEHKDTIIREAILREFDRKGQVYFVYNKVQDIDLETDKLRKLVPEVKFEYAHGQMGEKALENIILAFLNHEFDVLVSTTIIETGIDISNVNTIIIAQSDKMGLSQLYQLRGRVGRSNRMAYAYLTFKKDKLLSEIAQKRLNAIKEFTQLGSGLKIAMRDLEIRGSGNLLGASQSGNMDAIGYELYTKLLEEKVRQIKGEEIFEQINTQIEIKIDSYIPEYFINDPNIKIEVYKKIAAIENKEDKMDLMDELIDRFGNIPESVYNLILISHIRAMASNVPIDQISSTPKGFLLQFNMKNPPKEEYINKILNFYTNGITHVKGKNPGILLYYRDYKDIMKNKVQFLENFLEKIVS
jgi:transcription-repair coupling factor (superfamily II helicase)